MKKQSTPCNRGLGCNCLACQESRMANKPSMTPPLPPPGYELVEDEPREGDMAWSRGEWWDTYKSNTGMLYSGDGCCWINARDLRWIARKI